MFRPRNAALLVTFLSLASSAAADSDLIVAGRDSDSVFRFNQVTGAAVGTQPFASGGGLDQAVGVRYGPDGNLYVASQGTGEVKRYNAVTGAFIDNFITAHSGGLGGPADIRFHNGLLYVADFFAGSVYRYNAATGAFVDSLGLGGLAAQPTGLKFDSAGNLYVSSFANNRVVKYDPTQPPASQYSVFASGNGLNGPAGLTFGPDNNLYVVDLLGFDVRKFDGTTGAFIGSGPGQDQPFAVTGDQSFPSGILFTPGGEMLVTSLAFSSVLKFDSSSGAAQGTFASDPAMMLPSFMVLSPIPGDANADDIVDVSDIQLIAAHYLTSGPTGNLNGDNLVDISDIQVVAAHYLQTSYAGGGSGIATVPEPSTIALVAACLASLAGAGLVRRWRRP
ncbi:MAG: PEP-CTERM sorting domain-containing protein [Planctomycetia bacterium]|nr:PEP-CTERM sorting domain-containing protein [Planctomycetia bacterium]